MATHEFGGDWTEEKLHIVQQYLKPYIKIFTTNPAAKQYLSTIYIDAFAGSGDREAKKEEEPGSVSLFDMFGDDALTEDIRTPQTFKGSARYALELEPSFDSYIFIEKKKEFVEALEALRNEFPEKPNVSVRRGDAKSELKKIFEDTAYLQGKRAVVFLDPYGMQVDWETIRTIAKPEKVDLWLLWPIGLAINRMVPRSSLPNQGWARALDKDGHGRWIRLLEHKNGRIASLT